MGRPHAGGALWGRPSPPPKYPLPQNSPSPNYPPPQSVLCSGGGGKQCSGMKRRPPPPPQSPPPPPHILLCLLLAGAWTPSPTFPPPSPNTPWSWCRTVMDHHPHPHYMRCCWMEPFSCVPPTPLSPLSSSSSPPPPLFLSPPFILTPPPLFSSPPLPQGHTTSSQQHPLPLTSHPPSLPCRALLWDRAGGGGGYDDDKAVKPPPPPRTLCASPPHVWPSTMAG